MKALLSGATGLIGRHLVPRLGHVKVLVRDPVRARLSAGDVDAIAWDSSSAVPREALRDVDAVFRLAGEPIAGGREEALDPR